VTAPQKITDDRPRLALVGGFGHATSVFHELSAPPETGVFSAMAPAFADEPMEDFAALPGADGARRFDSLEQMLAGACPDVLVVSTRPDHIQPAILAGLRAGCHVIAEKPLALDFAGLDALAAGVRDSGRALMAMLSMRAAPAFEEARKWVADGRIGAPVLINTRKSYKWGTRPPWFNDRTRYGGTLPWIGIHNFDMAHFVTGLHARRVMALHGNRAHPHMPGCEDAAAATAELDGGVAMTVSVDLCRPGGAPSWGDDWIRVVGTAGVLEANGSRGTVTILTGDGAVHESNHGLDPLPLYAPFLGRLEARDPADAETALTLTAAALAARDAADAGGWVDVPRELSSQA